MANIMQKLLSIFENSFCDAIFAPKLCNLIKIKDFNR